MTSKGWALLESYLATRRTANNQPWSDSLSFVYRTSLEFLPDDVIPGLIKRLPFTTEWLPSEKLIAETARELLFGAIPDPAEGFRCFLLAFHAYDSNCTRKGFDLGLILRTLEEGAPEKTYSRGDTPIFKDGTRGEPILKTFVRPPITANPVNLTVLSAMGGFEEVVKWDLAFIQRQYFKLYGESQKHTEECQLKALVSGDYQRLPDGRARLGAGTYGSVAALLECKVDTYIAASDGDD